MSTQHAVLSWTDAGWKLKDLASRNGTMVDGSRIDAGDWVLVTDGTTIHFGSVAERWTVSSVSAPGVTAVCLDTGEVLEGEHGYLVVGDTGATVYTDNGEEFWLERGAVRRRAGDGAVVRLGGKRWRIGIPPASAVDSATLTAKAVYDLDDLTMCFEVGLDEEHVQVTLQSADRTTTLKSRSFDYMLVLLARAQIADNDAVGPPSRDGWIYATDLASALGMDITHLNVDIYRARRRFAEAGIRNPMRTIERRRSTHAIRLRAKHIVVTRDEG